jgi:hypothetical protein
MEKIYVLNHTGKILKDDRQSNFNPHPLTI